MLKRLLFIFISVVSLNAASNEALECISYKQNCKNFLMVENQKCNDGDKFSCFNVGSIYQNGYGVKKDLHMALYYFLPICLLNEDSYLKESSCLAASKAYESLNNTKEAKRYYQKASKIRANP